MANRLFVYGTLRDPKVQLGVFGREVESTEAQLPGWRLCEVVIHDERVLALSGLGVHRILEPGSLVDVVAGRVLELTDEELLRADEYETSDYKRVAARLQDGSEVFVYVRG